MMKTAVRHSLGILLAAGMACSAFAQAKPFPTGDLQKTYERLLREIDKIPMYDNHAHPGYADDSDVDAMASPPDESATLRLRDDNPEFVAAAKAQNRIRNPLCVCAGKPHHPDARPSRWGRNRNDGVSELQFTAF